MVSIIPSERNWRISICVLSSAEVFAAAEQAWTAEKPDASHCLSRHLPRRPNISKLPTPRVSGLDAGSGVLATEQAALVERLGAGTVGRGRRHQLTELGPRILQLAQLHLHAHRHPLEPPERLRSHRDVHYTVLWI